MGYRNNAAFIIATWFVNRGLKKEEVLTKLLEWNKERRRPPLPEKEIKNIVKSVYKHRYKPVSRGEDTQRVSKGFEAVL